jgi:hypothetical protein
MTFLENILLNTLFSNTASEKQKIFGMKIKYINSPLKLYKYYNFDSNGYHLENFRNNVVWLSTPDKFNDPYDCVLSFTTIKLINKIIKYSEIDFLGDIESQGFLFTDRQRKKIKTSNSPYNEMQKTILENELSKSHKTLNKKLIRFLTYGTDDESLYEEVSSILMNMHKGRSLICCFSEKNNSNLMWSHYAENHTGFCLEYSFKNLGFAHDININLLPVIYRNKMLSIDKYVSYNTNYFSYILAGIIKSKEWQYEKEWRLFFPLSEMNQSYNVPCPTKVIAGVRINNTQKNILKDIAKEKNIGFYQAKIDKYKFSINFIRED